MKVLQLTYRVPFPPIDGGAIGIYNITKGLYENGCEIDLVAINTPKHSQAKDSMKAYVRSQHDVFVDTSISPIKLLRNILFRIIPYNIERFISKDVSKKIIELLEQNQYDYVHIDGAFVAFYISTIRKHSIVPILIRTHNIEYVIWKRLAKHERNPLKKWFYNHLSKGLKKFECNYYNMADGIAAITPEDQERLIEMGVQKTTKVIPAGVDFANSEYPEKSNQEKNSIFMISALDWEPNIEGIKWFFKHVWEELLKRNPNIHLHIAGKSTPDWLLNSNYPNTKIHGFVDDAKVFKSSYQLMLVPLLSGGGMRVKIVEGLALGKCIISTSIGAEGIHYTHKHNLVIADTPKEWIDTICDYLEHDQKRIEIEKNAFELASTRYANKAVCEKYIELFEEIN